MPVLDSSFGLITDPATGGILQLRAGTASVVRANGTLLVAPDTGRALRLSGVAQSLLPMLTAGATLLELRTSLARSNPGSTDIDTKLMSFLKSLRDVGFLVTPGAVTPAQTRHKRLALFELDIHADRVSRVLHRVPNAILTAALGLLVLGAGGGITALLAFHGSIRFGLANLNSLDVVLVTAVMLGIVIPLHEFSHAIACRFAGVRVGSAGLMLVNGVIPAAYVDTSRAYMVTSRWRRAVIAAAGPFVDLTVAGASAWVTVSATETYGVAALLCGVTCVSFVMALNPFARSDGSRIIECFLDDELARRSALSTTRAALSTRRSVRLYRSACVLYLAGVAATGCFAWSHAG